MRYITIPADATITINGQSAPFSFVENLIKNTLTVDNKFGASLVKLHRSRDIRALFAAAKPGDVVKLPDELWADLKDAAENPSSPYIPAVMLGALSHLDAIVNAPSEAPKESAPPA